jgi:hypothetical protein
VKPHPSIAEPQCASCDNCPLAVKGSKVTEQGKAVTACSQHRMIVVAPLGKLDMPLRMKLAITSDWDKNPELEKEKWFAFNNYTDYLRGKGLAHTAIVVTKLRFDPNVPYPKVLFSPDRWLNDKEASVAKSVIRTDAVKNLLSGSWTPAGVDGVKTEEAAPAPAPAPAPKKAAPAPAPKKAVVPADDDEDVEIIPPKKAAPAPKAKVKIQDDDDEDAEIILPKKKAEPEAKAKKAKPASDETEAALPEDVQSLLSEWGED